LVNDHPMNLRDPALLEDKEKLPHYRFLFSDKEALELSLRMLFAALSLQNNQKSEKAKTRTMLKSLIQNFFGIENVEKIVKEGESLYLMNEEEIELVFKSDLYEVLTEEKSKEAEPGAKKQIDMGFVWREDDYYRQAKEEENKGEEFVVVEEPIEDMSLAQNRTKVKTFDVEN